MLNFVAEPPYLNKIQRRMITKNTPLTFAHIGDLHITDPNQQNYVDFLAIVAQRITRPCIHTIICKSPGSKENIFQQTGSDESSIGPWPENGIYATQLGPNRNAKPHPKK